MDMWQGKALRERRPKQTDIHYRIYNARTGELLSFNSTNSLDSLAADVLRTQGEHPGVRLVVREYDGPVY